MSCQMEHVTRGRYEGYIFHQVRLYFLLIPTLGGEEWGHTSHFYLKEREEE
jgi:hypothetical protein